MTKAKANVGDLIQLLNYVSEDFPAGSILRVHNIIDMSPIREKISSGDYEEEFIEAFYPERTKEDEVTAFPTWVPMDVDIHQECFGTMFFLENDDYNVLTKEEQKEFYLK
ncbi:hypothetical protein BV582_21760 [Bacillus paralicheniformis]|uniref:hypothetical protein n=1 Tax=Bacillus paralicheniformis TaxID=1648923 RepID=UPI000C76ADBC|nr:hypothetical protein [Bacillus paralicheniformis]PLC14195.1 hypothetical protein BV582_21760 [Bacillus paralicheniformis]